MSKSPPQGRRRFLKLVGLVGMTTAVNSTMLAWAQTRQAKPAGSYSPGVGSRPKAVADTSKAAAPPEISEDARALAQVIERRYGRHLNSKQLEAVTREIEDRLQGGKRLREVRLANHDEPDFTFRAS